MDRRVRRAPDPEWELMYRRGLSRRRIADLVRAPVRTISYHLAAARAGDPGLEDEHAAAAGTGSGTLPPRDRERTDRLIALVQAEGRYPSPGSPDPAERTLAAWLGRRRREAAAGTLAPAIRDDLACLPHWQEPARAAAGQARWQARLAELAAYRTAGNDWPRHKNTGTELEHALGVWLHSQRINLRRHELDQARAQALDTVLPGWRTGRIRGRKPRDLNTPGPGIPEPDGAVPRPGHTPGPGHQAPARGREPVTGRLSATGARLNALDGTGVK